MITKEKSLDEFNRLLHKLNAESVIMLGSVLGVRLYEPIEDITKAQPIKPRDAHDIIEDEIQAFLKLNRADRRYILKVMRLSLKKKDAPAAKGEGVV